MLGPVRVRNTSGWVPVPATQQRSLLAALLIRAGQLVDTDRLVEELWGERPPRTAYKTIHVYVMRLRRLLGEDGAGVLVTRGNGYELSIERADLDAWEFSRLAAAQRLRLGGLGSDLAHGNVGKISTEDRSPVHQVEGGAGCCRARVDGRRRHRD
jgi:DNA-binding SARP family transcriptional activator